MIGKIRAPGQPHTAAANILYSEAKRKLLGKRKEFLKNSISASKVSINQSRTISNFMHKHAWDMIPNRLFCEIRKNANKPISFPIS